MEIALEVLEDTFPEITSVPKERSLGLNIYLVDSMLNDGNYENSAVIVAKNEIDARNFVPAWDDEEQFNVTLIGVANCNQEEGCILWKIEH